MHSPIKSLSTERLWNVNLMYFYELVLSLIITFLMYGWHTPT